MKGIILAGGTGSRLFPLTCVTNKHLLPVYNLPMIYYPIATLKRAGITDIMIVSGRGHAGDFLELLGSGSSLGVNLSYEVQEEAGGIAQALGLTARFSAGEKIAVVLGDNILEDDVSKAVSDFSKSDKGAHLFLKSVHNPKSYGVAELNDNGEISVIVEKPSLPKTDLAVSGCYLYDSTVYEVVKTLKPSARGELEITDVNNHYISTGSLTHSVLNGFWGDGGENFDSLFVAADMVRNNPTFRAEVEHALGK